MKFNWIDRGGSGLTGEKKTNLPIGYWLKKVDELLTARINEAQEANGLLRTEWQILNFLFENSAATNTQITGILQPFADADTVQAAVDRLIQRGLIVAKGEGTSELALTEQGLKVHARALQTQKQVRQQAMQGISDEEYATTVRVLQQMVANLSSGEMAR